MNPEEKAREIYEQGFCVLPAVYNADECRRMIEIMDAHWRDRGSPPLENFGFNIHPMMPQTPDIAPFLDQPLVIETTRETLRDDVRLVHLGARMSDRQSAERIEWHNHYAWDAASIPRRERIERVLWGIYVDGSNAEAGPLIALPRQFIQPLHAPLGELSAAWPGEVEVSAPPGSVVIFDTALWHAARRGSKATMRHLWGCHVQGWNDDRTHPEDNLCDVPEIAEYKRTHPTLRSLVERV